ncbi:hypothetical protein [Acetobacter persici]|uniref:hypothetical protein n=1 Tax=Acetobacter persici TaxID=1076596 RepID=UPI001BA8BB27|nr:hypothetical protein [Acetobacter persici]MBS1015176.1 hypothetical protein [Acetobacter persici]
MSAEARTRHYTCAKKAALLALAEHPPRTGYHYPEGHTNGAAGLAGGEEPLVLRIRWGSRWHYRLTKAGYAEAKRLKTEN